jgi:hypothetical protein
MLSLLAVSILISCSDDIRDVGGFIHSAGKPQPGQLSTWEFMHAFDLPQGPQWNQGRVAVLAKSRDLRAYGIVDANHEGLSVIDLWGYGDYPIRLASIYIDGVSPQGNRIERYQSVALIYTALEKAPKLRELLRSKSLFSYEDSRRFEYFSIAEKEHQKIVQTALSQGQEFRTWSDIYEGIYRHEMARVGNFRDFLSWGTQSREKPKGLSSRARSAMTFYPPGREPHAPEFGGFLPRDPYALFVIEDTLVGKKQNLKIFINPLLNDRLHPTMPRIQERIRLEERWAFSFFPIEGELILIEIASSEFGRTQWIGFENKSHVPRNIPFYRINPRTGEAVDWATGTQPVREPTILARSSQDAQIAKLLE